MLETRDLVNLGCTEEEAKLAIKEVENIFKKGFLNARNNHRLQKLWKRCDRLSTVELFTLGKCLLEIKGKPYDKEWLSGIVSKIKKHKSKGYQGFFTELFFAGFAQFGDLEIYPSPNSNPGYDFEMVLKNNKKNLISIKNLDISEKQEDFQKNCKLLTKKWIERLRSKKKNLSLIVVSSKHLEKDDFEKIIQFIQTEEIIIDQLRPVANGIDIKMAKLPYSNTVNSLKFVSYTVNVFCPPHKSELTRYKRKIKSAIENLHKYAPEGSVRTLFMRVHIHADINMIQRELDLLAQHDDRIDFIFLYQPSYVRNSNNSSHLHYYLKVFAKPETLIADVAENGHLKLNVPLGMASTDYPHIIIKGGKGAEPVKLQPSDYFFQMGDIYYEIPSSGGNFILGSPAVGIIEHGIFNDCKLSYIASARQDELLVI